MPTLARPPETLIPRHRIVAEARRQVSKLLTREALAGGVARMELLDGIDQLITDLEPQLAPSLMEAVAGGYLAGAESSLGMLPASFSFGPPPSATGSPPAPPRPPAGLFTPSPGDPDEPIFPSLQKALETLSAREVMQPTDYYALDSDARQQAFTITADITDQSRRKMHAALVADLDEGTSFAGFKERVLDSFDRLPIGEAHLEQVYRNAVNESFSRGMDHVLDHPMVGDEFPYRLYAAIRDARARKEHLELESLGLDGTAVYHKDDPTWLKFRPPWSWNCRCGWVALSIEDAARRGVAEAIEWLQTGFEPPHRWVTPPPFNPPAGWNRTALAGAA